MQDFKNFSADKIHALFSKCRISSYDNINQHFDNFDLIASISKNLGIAKVLLRNKIDSVMCGQDSAWLDNLPSDIELESKEPNPSRDKIISIQILVFWVKVAEKYKIESKIFDKAFLDNLDFRRYYARNVNYLTKKRNLQNYQKANLLLHLLRNLRNRAFHFENLYNQPRLSAKLYKPKFIVNLESTKIQIFLNDLIDVLVS